MSKKGKKALIAATKTAIGIQTPAASTATVEVPTTSLASVPASDPTSTAAAEGPAPTKPSRAHRPAGLGHPNAKKLVNPQHTLEMKKQAAQKLGGSMHWTNKNWVIKVPAGEFTFASRALAGLSLATFTETVSQKPAAKPAEVPVLVDASIDEEKEMESDAAEMV